MSMNDDLEKLKWHVRLLGEAVPQGEHPVTRLVVRLGWSEEQLGRAQDVFDKYDKLHEAGRACRPSDLEVDLKKECDVGYQEVKDIVAAFYDNGQWPDICQWYARGQTPGCPSDLKRILREDDGQRPVT